MSLVLASVASPLFATWAHAGGPQELTVFAAASLREVFQNIALAFEKQHPNLKVHFNFAGSQDLRVQIEQGAKADVFASADWKHMKALATQGLVAEPTVFARSGEGHAPGDRRARGTNRRLYGKHLHGGRKTPGQSLRRESPR
jgi:ABC-type molybdate transport system substrate-binding protein